MLHAPPPPRRDVLPSNPSVSAPAATPSTQTLLRNPQALHEESNIRWGELVGGLLIIGCSIALVLTFWEQIATQPWLRFSFSPP